MIRTKFVVKTRTRNWYSITFLKIVLLWENMWKYGIARQVADVNAIFVQVIKQSQKYMSMYLKW